MVKTLKYMCNNARKKNAQNKNTVNYKLKLFEYKQKMILARLLVKYLDFILFYFQNQHAIEIGTSHVGMS